jgi:hypothetical protein
MGALEELGLVEADVGALALDRLEERRRAPAREPRREFCREGAKRISRRFERDELARKRAQHLKESVDAGELIGKVAERLGISAEAAEQAYPWARPNAPLPPTICAILGRPKQRREHAALVEALGGEDEFDSLAAELAEGLREAA